MASSPTLLKDCQTANVQDKPFDLENVDEVELVRLPPEAPQTPDYYQNVCKGSLVEGLPSEHGPSQPCNFSEGFSFGPRAPVVPGQFSNRPQKKFYDNIQPESYTAVERTRTSAKHSSPNLASIEDVVESGPSSFNSTSSTHESPSNFQTQGGLDLKEISFQPKLALTQNPYAQRSKPEIHHQSPDKGTQWICSKDDGSTSKAIVTPRLVHALKERLLNTEGQDSLKKLPLRTSHTSGKAQPVPPPNDKDLPSHSSTVQISDSPPVHHSMESPYKYNIKKSGLETSEFAASSSPAMKNNGIGQRHRAGQRQTTTPLRSADARRDRKLQSNSKPFGDMKESSPVLPQSYSSHFGNRVHDFPQAHHQRSPSSMCGDLEPPTHTYNPPRRSRNSIYDGPQGMVNRPMRSYKVQEKISDYERRSQSQASNISRKRSSVNKPRKFRDSGRKKAAMFQVAEYWNQCMQIAEEEKEEAAEEIDRLRDELARQSQQIENSTTALEQKMSHIEEIQSRCKALEQHDAANIEANKQLSKEVEQLQHQLSESKQKALQLTDRYKSYKEKINQAIVEQQDLFKQSKNYYQRTLQQIQDEKSNHEEKALKVDDALKASSEKRAEMKRVFQVFQDQMKEESEKKDKLISHLQERVKGLETDVIREQELGHQLNVQAETSNGFLQGALGDIETKMDVLINCCKASLDCNNQHSEAIAQLAQRTQEMIEAIEKPKETDHAPDLNAFMARLEDRITLCESNTSAEIASRQNDLERRLSILGGAFGNELTAMKKAISSYVDQIGRPQMESIDQTVTKALDYIDAELRKARISCENTENHVSTIASSVREALETATDSNHFELMKQLQHQDQNFSQLGQQIQLLSENYEAKIEDLRIDMTKNDGEAAKSVQDTTDKMMAQLGTLLDEAKQASSQKLGAIHETNLALLAQLGDTKALLASTGSNSSTTVVQLQQKLEREQASVSEMRQKLDHLEKESRAGEALQYKWQKDINTIDDLRSKLNMAYNRMPRIENMAAKLENINRMNSFIHSTASYLASEKNWVYQELAVRRENDHNYTMSNTLPETLQASSTTENGQDVADGMIPLCNPIVDEELMPRKVLVRAEADCHSPSPPPSIEQEKKRRRETSRPRSILRPGKNNEQSSHETSQKIELLGMKVANPSYHYSQYNRPVVADPVRGNGSRLNDGIHEQIRSGLIPPPRPREPFQVFTTVGDFEKESHYFKDDNSIMGESKPTPNFTSHYSEQGKKRYKMEENVSHLESPVAMSQKRRNSKISRPKILRTYSRKEDDLAEANAILG